MDDDAIRAVVKRLARPHSSGGDVIERAAIQAAGVDVDAVMRWITDHAGVAEAAVAVTGRGGGLHGARTSTADSLPRRFVLPPGALA